MQTARLLSRLDFRVVVLVVLLQAAGLAVISSYSPDFLLDPSPQPFLFNHVIAQLEWIVLSWVCFFAAVRFDYAKLREFAWFIYVCSLFLLVGLFFTDPIVRVHRWYRLPIVGLHVQPSEMAKLAVVVALSWSLERFAHSLHRRTTLLFLLSVVALPCFFIFKQPDLGTTMVFYPMTIVIFYFGGISLRVIRLLCLPGICALALVAVTFSGIIPYDRLQPLAGRFLKVYQCERLNPDTHHQKASQTAIALGGVSGAGWRQGEYWRGGSLPAPYTDSVFAAFGEEFGLLGLICVLICYYLIISCCFQAAAMAKDGFGRLITAGIGIYIAVHVAINVGMMCGCLPVTGVPLLFMSYGGSSMAMTMTALGITQSVYVRRFMF